MNPSCFESEMKRDDLEPEVAKKIEASRITMPEFFNVEWEDVIKIGVLRAVQLHNEEEAKQAAAEAVAEAAELAVKQAAEEAKKAKEAPKQTPKKKPKTKSSSTKSMKFDFSHEATVEDEVPPPTLPIPLLSSFETSI